MNTFRKTISRLFPIFPFKHHFTALSAFLFLALGIFITPESLAFEIPLVLRIILMISAVVLARKTAIPFILLGTILTADKRDEFWETVDYFSNQGESEYVISFCKAPQYKSREFYKQAVTVKNGNWRGRALGEFNRAVIPGETLTIRGSITPFPKESLPWSRSEEKSLHSNLHGKLTLSSDLPPISQNAGTIPGSKITHYFSQFSPQTASLLHALFLADRSYLSGGMKELFHAGGVSHLLALSGLHIATILILMNLILNRLPLSKKMRYLFLSTLPWSITIFTGLTPSIVRALTMSTLLLGSFLCKRPGNSLNSLGAAGVLLLFHSPFQLYTPGFQLSFSAVFGIIIGIRRVQNLQLSFKIRKLVIFLIVPLSAALATTPVTLLFFQEACPRGIVSNLIITPLFSLYFTAVSLLLIAGSIIPKASVAVEYLTQIFLQLLQSVVNIFEISTTTLPIKPELVITAVIFALITLFISHKHRLKVLLYFLLTLFTIFLLPQSKNSYFSNDTVLFEEHGIISIEFKTNTPSPKAVEWLCKHSKNKELILKIPELSDRELLRTLYLNGKFKKIYILSEAETRFIPASNNLFSFLETGDTLYLQNQAVIP